LLSFSEQLVANAGGSGTQRSFSPTILLPQDALFWQGSDANAITNSCAINHARYSQSRRWRGATSQKRVEPGGQPRVIQAFYKMPHFVRDETLGKFAKFF
jgi:hypothetical protein